MGSEYVPITKELRDYAGVAWEPWSAARERLFQICDNIDAIHRSLEQENERLRDSSERGDDWIKLPVDADGVTICVGDMLAEGEASPDSVKCLMLDCDGWSVNFGLGWCGMKYHEWHHAKPDTWERIIEDAREYSLNIGGSYLWKNKSDELIARCKALAGEDE